jgi:hypothetical protein
VATSAAPVPDPAQRQHLCQQADQHLLFLLARWWLLLLQQQL